MKMFLFIFAIIFVLGSFSLFADYTSPGNGVYFNLDSLVTNSGGAVTSDSANYYINQSVLISTTDTLIINYGKNVVFTDVSGNVELEINGALLAIGSVEDSIVFTSQNQTAGDYYGIRFRNTSVGSDLQMRYCLIEFATRAIDVVNADAFIENCLIQYNEHTAVDLSSSNSTVLNCVIRRNTQRTIFMTLSSSPTIEGNYIYENNIANSSPYPFINIGLQGVNSPSIVDNTITGGNEMSGGIAIWNDSNGEIINNTIENCGYGILCFQQNANPYIKNNTIRNNTIHPDTLNWGFAIACNGNNAPVISENIIEGNYYGIAIINGAQPNVGNLSNADTTDDGNNQFLGNGLGNNLYELYNNNSLLIFAENNWWNTDNPDSVEARIVHQVDNTAYGSVDYNPFIQSDPSGIAEERLNNPQNFELYAAYPNPFNPETQISFKLGINTPVAINIFNVLGEYVNSILEKDLSVGFHKYFWDGRNYAGQKVSSGLYFYTIQIGNQIISNKIVLLR
jgi:parallel beta-helix repeat protein